jgi:hypothetical protein
MHVNPDFAAAMEGKTGSKVLRLFWDDTGDGEWGPIAGAFQAVVIDHAVLGKEFIPINVGLEAWFEPIGNFLGFDPAAHTHGVASIFRDVWNVNRLRPHCP